VSPLALILRGLIRAYQWTLAPVLGANCRFVPSCSQYACEAIGRHGAAAGVYLGAKRLLRCNPWGGCGCDPVPETAPFTFGRPRTCDGARGQAR
jgi:putative membrane protein insertion efficiency factor